jgi:hypothetical protein
MQVPFLHRSGTPSTIVIMPGDPNNTNIEWEAANATGTLLVGEAFAGGSVGDDGLRGLADDRFDRRKVEMGGSEWI